MSKTRCVISGIRVLLGNETRTYEVMGGRLRQHRERQKSRNLKNLEVLKHLKDEKHGLEECKPVDNDVHPNDDDELIDWENQSNDNSGAVD